MFETELHCAGMCTQSDNYMFAGVETQPRSSCQDAVTDWVHSHSGRWIGWSMLFSVVGLMGVGSALAIFNVERKKQTPDNFYQQSKSRLDE